MPQQQVILAASGFDRPGLMDEIASHVTGLGAFVADSRSINLRGQFALLVLIGGPRDAVARIRSGIGEFASRMGIHAHIEDAAATDSGDTYPYRLSATGKNHPRVIQAISHLMRVLGINIESLQTQETGQDGPERRGFRMELGLAIPREVPIIKLREFLDHLCSEMDVKYELTNA